MEELLDIAIKASLEAGNEIMRIYTDPTQDFGIEKKADNSPLTLADKASHECIMRHLDKTNIPVLSEEGKSIPYDVRKEWCELWIVDPLDGTKEFIKKNGEFTVNVALVRAGVPVMGVVYVPVTKTLYYGLAGKGAWKKVGEAQPIAIPVKEPRDVYRVVASRSHMSAETELFVEEMRRLHEKVELVSSGSSIKICLVAEGSADVYPRYAPTMEWDTAAGDAVVRAAGKIITNADGSQPLLYNKEDLHNPWFVVS